MLFGRVAKYPCSSRRNNSMRLALDLAEAPSLPRLPGWIGESRNGTSLQPPRRMERSRFIFSNDHLMIRRVWQAKSFLLVRHCARWAEKVGVEKGRSFLKFLRSNERIQHDRGPSRG